jgi:hypothetical protein
LKSENPDQKVFSVNLRNTGIVPAKSVQTNVLLVNAETWAYENVIHQDLPLIVPNQEIPVIIYIGMNKLRERATAGVYNLELTFEYKGMDKSYETKQSFRVGIHERLSKFVWIPIEPSDAI